MLNYKLQMRVGLYPRSLVQAIILHSIDTYYCLAVLRVLDDEFWMLDVECWIRAGLAASSLVQATI